MSLLFLFLSIINPSDDKLSGNWVPLYYEDAENLNCHQRSFEQPITISFKDGILSFDECNHISYYYTLNSSTFSLKRTHSNQTELGCTALIADIEYGFQKNSTFKYSMRDDTLVINLNEQGRLQLIRVEKFDKSWYHGYYKNLGCQWPLSKLAISSDSINNQPVYRYTEIQAQLLGGCDPQEFINDNLERTRTMVQFGVNHKVFVFVTIDKNGEIHSFRTAQSCGSPCELEIDRILSMMSRWEPALIDDRLVNSEQILVFDYRKESW